MNYNTYAEIHKVLGNLEQAGDHISNGIFALDNCLKTEEDAQTRTDTVKALYQLMLLKEKILALYATLYEKIAQY